MHEDQKPADARFKPSRRRFVLACVAAPLLTPLVVFATGLALDQSHLTDDFFVQLLYTYMYYSAFAYFAELVLGLPAWKIFQHYRIQSGVAFAMCGGLIGLIAGFVLRLVWEGALVCVVAGVASAHQSSFPYKPEHEPCN